MATTKKTAKTAASKGPKTYKTLTALVKAKTAGELPRGFKLFFDGGAVVASTGVNFTMSERAVAEHALKLLGLKSKDV